MTTVVAGLFDSEANATEAMDKLLREHIKDMETRVVEGRGRDTSSEPNIVVPLIPNTSGGINNGASGPVVGAAAIGGRDEWLADQEGVERAFYLEGLKEGSTLALARVHDEDADHVRDLMRRYGARTYEKR